MGHRATQDLYNPSQEGVSGGLIGFFELCGIARWKGWFEGLAVLLGWFLAEGFSVAAADGNEVG